MAVDRREFLRGAAAVGLGGVAANSPIMSRLSAVVQDSAAAGVRRDVDLAAWSYFWVGVEQARLARGTFVTGRQMYVEYWIPARLTRPFPIVLVHGGGGQGTDWMGTPDGRPGWVTILLQEGYAVYVVDRPGHGRSPFHPDLDGPFPAQAVTLEGMSGQFTPPNAARPAVNALRKLHVQWPGTGEVGSTDLDQFVASQGGAYAAAAGAGPGAPGGPSGRGAAPGARGTAPAPPAQPAQPAQIEDGGESAGAETAHMVWRQRGAMLLDKIGPAIIMTHSAGGPFGWLVAEARPNLVKAIVAIEGGGQPFAGQNIWGMSSIPVTYDPPAARPSDIKTRMVAPPDGGAAYRLQEEPARTLKNLKGIPIVIVTSEASFASPGNPAAIAFFKQAGCDAEELRIVDRGIHGNGHMMMVEKNNREVLQPIIKWIDAKAPASARGVGGAAPAVRRGADSTAMKLADHGFFWVGTERKKMPYGTIIAGQMYVQYLTPAQVRHPFPVVLVHGGTGQMLHYMGAGDGLAGWAHYYVQEGYRVFLIDRPGHGRSPYHPDALGPIGPQPVYTGIVADFKRATEGPNRQWSGTGDVHDPLVDQFMASQNAAPQDRALAERLWASRGAELLDKIGPAIVQVHSAGGPFGWFVGRERPALVKALVNVEGGGLPFNGDDNASAQKLRGIPIVYVTAEQSGRTQGPPTVAYLKQNGCTADDLQLKDLGIRGNGHFMMFENNRRQVFDAIRGWIEKNVKA